MVAVAAEATVPHAPMPSITKGMVIATLDKRHHIFLFLLIMFSCLVVDVDRHSGASIRGELFLLVWADTAQSSGREGQRPSGARMPEIVSGQRIPRSAFDKAAAYVALGTLSRHIVKTYCIDHFLPPLTPREGGTSFVSWYLLYDLCEVELEHREGPRTLYRLSQAGFRALVLAATGGVGGTRPEILGERFVLTGVPGVARGGTAVLVGVPASRLDLDVTDLLVDEQRFVGSTGARRYPSETSLSSSTGSGKGASASPGLSPRRTRSTRSTRRSRTWLEGRVLGRAVLTFGQDR